MQRISNHSQYKKASKIEDLLICKSKLVRVRDYRWNHLLLALHLIYSKLEKLGFIFVNGEVIYLGDKETGNV